MGQPEVSFVEGKIGLGFPGVDASGLPVLPSFSSLQNSAIGTSQAVWKMQH